jgi:hypothetical protein
MPFHDLEYIFPFQVAEGMQRRDDLSDVDLYVAAAIREFMKTQPTFEEASWLPDASDQLTDVSLFCKVRGELIVDVGCLENDALVHQEVPQKSKVSFQSAECTS